MHTYVTDELTNHEKPKEIKQQQTESSCTFKEYNGKTKWLLFQEWKDDSTKSTNIVTIAVCVKRKIMWSFQMLEG